VTSQSFHPGLVKILESFLDASRGALNKIKFQIYSRNSIPKEMKNIVSILQFPLVYCWSYFRYLGIPVSLKYTTSQDWNGILEKLSKNLVQWRTQWLKIWH
jgi:hypothetical protein